MSTPKVTVKFPARGVMRLSGEPVTITIEQCAAILHALDVYKRVTLEPGASGPRFDVDAAIGTLRFMHAKSCLMGRMLYDGRDPLSKPPPVVMGAPAYHLADPDLCAKCGGPLSKPGLYSSGAVCANQGHAPAVADAPVDCRSDEGITVGLIDSIITAAHVLAARDLTPDPAQQALADLRDDPDVAAIIGPRWPTNSTNVTSSARPTGGYENR